MLVFFFFQAEDSIRDGHLTGVQPCALPIFENPANWKRSAVRRATCDSDCCCRNDENMPDDSSTNGIRRNLIVPKGVSRRDFLCQIGRLGSLVPASRWLLGLAEMLALEGSPASPATRKP